MKLVRRLLRPLWREDPGYRKRRVLRQLLMVPILSVAGALWGALASPTDAAVLGWMAGGALGFGATGWLYLHLQPALLAWSELRLGARGRWVGALLDWVVVGLAIWVVTHVLGMPTFPAVTAAIGLGGAYAGLVLGFWDDAGSRVLNALLVGVRGGGFGSVAPPFSHIRALLVKGEWESARAALERFVDDHPTDPRGWLELARVVARSGEDGDREEAVAHLRTGLERATASAEIRRSYVGEMLAIRESQGRPDLAGRELARLADEERGTVIAMWAQQELARLRKSATPPDDADPVPPVRPGARPEDPPR